MKAIEPGRMGPALAEQCIRKLSVEDATSRNADSLVRANGVWAEERADRLSALRTDNCLMRRLRSTKEWPLIFCPETRQKVLIVSKYKASFETTAGLKMAILSFDCL